MHMPCHPSTGESTVRAHKERCTVKKTYVLIDYENVQPKAMAALDREHITVIVFVGANQAKVTYEVASVLQRMKDRATYIQIAGSGSNALDFHIAYYIGKLSEKEPDANFFIVSKDTGFDPLIRYLKSERISSSRVKTISELPLVKLATSQSAPDQISAVIENLAKSGATKPRTRKTLAATINSWFRKPPLSEAEVERIIAELIKKGIVEVNESRVSYDLPRGL
jgi:PIN domain